MTLTQALVAICVAGIMLAAFFVFSLMWAAKQTVKLTDEMSSSVLDDSYITVGEEPREEA